VACCVQWHDLNAGARRIATQTPEIRKDRHEPKPDILGIETSCDETAAAGCAPLRRISGEILADVVLSQLDLHSAFGGVVPELAARSHVSTLDRLIKQALEESACR
jgi:hypothetical protein